MSLITTLQIPTSNKMPALSVMTVCNVIEGLGTYFVPVMLQLHKFNTIGPIKIVVIDTNYKFIHFKNNKAKRL